MGDDGIVIDRAGFWAGATLAENLNLALQFEAGALGAPGFFVAQHDTLKTVMALPADIFKDWHKKIYLDEMATDDD